MIYKENQKKYGSIKVVNSITTVLKNGQKTMTQKFIQHTMKENLLLLKDLLRLEKIRFTDK